MEIVDKNSKLLKSTEKTQSANASKSVILHINRCKTACHYKKDKQL